MTSIKPVPLDAYSAAYDALADTPLAHDPDLRSRVAQQVVDTVTRLRTDKGLAWLRKIGNRNSYYDEAQRVIQTFGPDPELITGRIALWGSFERTAETFIAAFGRAKNAEES